MSRIFSHSSKIEVDEHENDVVLWTANENCGKLWETKCGHPTIPRPTRTGDASHFPEVYNRLTPSRRNICHADFVTTAPGTVLCGERKHVTSDTVL